MQRPALPTIAFLRAEGVRGVRVSCVDRECKHFSVVSFDALAVLGETRFPDLVRVRRFTCTAFGGSKVCSCRIGRRIGRGADEKALSSPAGLEVVWTLESLHRPLGRRRRPTVRSSRGRSKRRQRTIGCPIAPARHLPATCAA